MELCLISLIIVHHAVPEESLVAPSEPDKVCIHLIWNYNTKSCHSISNLVKSSTTCRIDLIIPTPHSYFLGWMLPEISYQSSSCERSTTSLGMRCLMIRTMRRVEKVPRCDQEFCSPLSNFWIYEKFSWVKRNAFLPLFPLWWGLPHLARLQNMFSAQCPWNTQHDCGGSCIVLEILDDHDQSLLSFCYCQLVSTENGQCIFMFYCKCPLYFPVLFFSSIWVQLTYIRPRMWISKHLNLYYKIKQVDTFIPYSVLCGNVVLVSPHWSLIKFWFVPRSRTWK